MTEMFSWNRHGHLTLFSLKTHPPPNASLVPGIHKKVVILTNIVAKVPSPPLVFPVFVIPCQGPQHQHVLGNNAGISIFLSFLFLNDN